MPVHAIASSAGVAGSFVGKLLAQENHDLACDATTEGFPPPPPQEKKNMFLKKRNIKTKSSF